MRLWKGRFILATNILDPVPASSDSRETPPATAILDPVPASTDPQEAPAATAPQLSYEQMLPAYKTQSSAPERGFRLLKDPMFFADNLFLKSPARIMAMIMVMGIALLVYSLAAPRGLPVLRQQLKLHDETLPHQTGKPTQSITMRRVAQIFEGIDFLVIRAHGQIIARKILNLSPVRLKILAFFSPQVRNFYFVPT